MRAPLQLEKLVADSIRAYPSAQIEFDPMPSGVCFLWLTLNGRELVIEYDPKRGAGVSENFPTKPLFIGHDEVFPSLDEGIARFKTLLADAVCVEAQAHSACVLQDKLNSA